VTFPALLALATDPVISKHPIAQRVYLHVLATLDFSQPRDVKGWVIAKELKVRPQTVYGSLDTLVARGFLTDHGRSVNNVRRFTLAWAQPLSALPRRTSPEEQS
jgi:predicted transcriptional regulator